MSNPIIRNIPNAITCCNLISGCIATGYAFAFDARMALVWIITGAAFDFFDGMLARLLHAYSNIGKDLDSLADDVSFGVAPSMMVFSLFREMCQPATGVCTWLPYVAFLIAVFSALRLAKFNNDSRQTTSFIGLPVPANALFWASLVTGGHDFLLTHLYMPVCLVPLICLFSWLLVSEIPMFSLKFKSLKWKDNKVSFTFLLVCIPLLALLGACSFAAIIVWYIILSLVAWKKA